MPAEAEAAQSAARFVRSTHPYAFNSGLWGQIVGERERDGRKVWLVVWNDGSTDEWAVEDPQAMYEFSETGA